MSDEPKYRDEEWLREQYVEKKLSTLEIADKCGCSDVTISNWLKKHGIAARSGGRPLSDKRLTAEEWLREQYAEKRRSTLDIAEQCECSSRTVNYWLTKHGIETRSQNPIPDQRLADEEWLREQYVEKRRTSADIAEQCGCHSRTVIEWMKRHGIESRNVSGANHPKWNGGEIPYGPGWNDSKRRQVRERDGYECADCGTTQAEHKAKYDQKLHVHHLIKARNIDDAEERNASENLLTLCRDCHREWERLSEAGIRPQIDGVTAD